jgi:phosphoribosylanthranilate isomerase
MRRTRIKFCGITRPQDAVAATAAGADAIGLVLYPPAGRAVTVDQAREIVAALPPFVTPVGLFVNQPVGEIIDVAGRLGLGAVQLHGDESPYDVARLAPLRVIKAIHATADRLADAVAPWRSVPVAALLLETAGGPAVGGTGVANDWAGLAAAQRIGTLDGLPPLIVAGGLTPETVGGVVRALRPFAVDVSSGIEVARRTKSPERMATFIAAVRAADDDLNSEGTA